MCAENRRTERKKIFLISWLMIMDFISQIHDFTEFEEYNRYLEGTGSMILDRENNIVMLPSLNEQTNKQ